LGFINDCRCFNDTKAAEMQKSQEGGFRILNREFNTYQELLDNAYDPCP